MLLHGACCSQALLRAFYCWEDPSEGQKEPRIFSLFTSTTLARAWMLSWLLSLGDAACLLGWLQPRNCCPNLLQGASARLKGSTNELDIPPDITACWDHSPALRGARGKQRAGKGPSKGIHSTSVLMGSGFLMCLHSASEGAGSKERAMATFLLPKDLCIV